jgi:hypothetical protein
MMSNVFHVFPSKSTHILEKHTASVGRFQEEEKEPCSYLNPENGRTCSSETSDDTREYTAL